LLQGEHVAALENAEFRRRVQFLALTFNQTLPPAYTASTVPHFTVLIPHYSEKILLDLVDVLKPPDMDASSCCVSALDYLKRLYPTEWHNFAHESKLLAVQQGHDSEPLSVAETNSSRTSLLGCLLRQPPPAHHVHMNGHARPRRNVLTEPLHPAYSLIGYRIASDTFTLRTRMWASLRMQTVYRTLSGMFKYKHALDVLDRINGTFGSASKFSLVVSMQRLMHLPKRHETLQLLFALFPTICIAYIDQTDDGVYYSCLLDKDHPTVPRFRIRVGIPISSDVR
jgi:1,3-beta-glucan synthase